MSDVLRLAFGTLTVLPVRPPVTVDRRTAGFAMSLAPLTGAVLGGVATALVWSTAERAGPLLSATLAIAVLAVGSRLLHWDGLADTADALGSRKPADEALAIMRRSDIGPFGVVAIVLLLAVQVTALAQLAGSGTGPSGVLVATVLSRWALTLGCSWSQRPGRADGLGNRVVGSVTPSLLAAAAALTAGVVAAVVALAPGLGWVAAAVATGAVTLWCVLASGFLTRRLGGLTGDTLGALAESSAALALVVLVLV
ncbi:MAG TPA: adenosylcobinamide-GDP ribazoletransferase [Nocardioidaceae bacterium]|nr:adenosylcobinamide-GDP ribazoletransferase [Nocardioidaceae bacterium]